MKTNRLLVALVIAVVIGAGGYGLYRLGLNHAAQSSGAASTAGPVASTATGIARTGEIEQASGKKVLYWHDPMVPGQKFDKPGKSPFMDMEQIGRAHV